MFVAILEIGPYISTVFLSLYRIYRERFARHLNKRATVDPRKTTCMLYLQADHQFFARYGTEEACIEVMTRHVQRVNSIYKHTGELFMRQTLTTLITPRTVRSLVNFALCAFA